MGTRAFARKKHLRDLAFKGHNEFAAQTLCKYPYHAQALAAHASQTPIVPLKRENEEWAIVSIVKKPSCPLWLNLPWCRRHNPRLF